jgi:hypothetical protein
MALESETIKKICDFVKIKPRAIQEVAELIKKNWRTAERYVEKIEQETGCISTRVFREGTRGALKIVYWNAIEDIHSTSFQEELLDAITQGKRKQDFSPFDIYQYVPDKKKKAYVEDISKIDPDIEISEEQDLIGFLRQASRQVLILSGNLSWINSHQGEINILNILRELIKRNISIKVIARVSMIGAENVKKLLAMNKEPGRDMVEVRHRYQPLRAIIVDNKAVKLREIRDPAYYRAGELKKKIEVFYDIYDKDWIEWLQKIFWKMFSNAMPAEKRIKEIELIQNRIL